MFQSAQSFIHRLVERLIPIVAASFSSAVETFHALGQAEHQDQLEQAARRYEADDKPEIAAALRRRAAQLTSNNPLGQALEIYENVAADQLPSSSNGDRAASDLDRLPDFGVKAAKPRRKKPRSSDQQPNG